MKKRSPASPQAWTEWRPKRHPRWLAATLVAFVAWLVFLNLVRV